MKTCSKPDSTSKLFLSGLFVFQREFIKFLDVIDSGTPQEIVKYRSQHDTSSYNQIIKQYEDQLEKKSNVRKTKKKLTSL